MPKDNMKRLAYPHQGKKLFWVMTQSYSEHEPALTTCPTRAIRLAKFMATCEDGAINYAGQSHANPSDPPLPVHSTVWLQ